MTEAEMDEFVGKSVAVLFKRSRSVDPKYRLVIHYSKLYKGKNRKSHFYFLREMPNTFREKDVLDIKLFNPRTQVLKLQVVDKQQ